MKYRGNSTIQILYSTPTDDIDQQSDSTESTQI